MVLWVRGVGVPGQHRSDPLGFSLGIERVNSDCRYITKQITLTVSGVSNPWAILTDSVE